MKRIWRYTQIYMLCTKNWACCITETCVITIPEGYPLSLGRELATFEMIIELHIQGQAQGEKYCLGAPRIS